MEGMIIDPNPILLHIHSKWATYFPTLREPSYTSVSESKQDTNTIQLQITGTAIDPNMIPRDIRRMEAAFTLMFRCESKVYALEVQKKLYNILTTYRGVPGSLIYMEIYEEDVSDMASDVLNKGVVTEEGGIVILRFMGSIKAIVNSTI